MGKGPHACVVSGKAATTPGAFAGWGEDGLRGVCDTDLTHGHI